MRQILIVEDDTALSRGIALALQSADLAVTPCGDCAAARELLAARRFDLILLDVNLPDGSGLDLLARLRQTVDTPVILLTANDLETDVVAGLSLGADDYITKPFSLAVLRARAEVQLRRTGRTKPAVFRQGGFMFDFDRLEFSCGEQRIELSRTEQKLLRLLVENRGVTVPRERLLDRIWTDGAEFVDENALSVAVNRLRGKLGGEAPIRTVYGVGYAWAVES
jgi:DNA-binding response OmpR family regulator